MTGARRLATENYLNIPIMPTSDELTAQQKLQWSRAAEGWERQYEWFEGQSRDLTAWLCGAAGLVPGLQVLDLASGSGQPASTAALRVRPGGGVTATDLSPDMVAVARRTARRLGLDNLEVREMDMRALAFPDGMFDAATCRFGLMFCPDPVRAAAEVRRVLKPGGRFALAVWDEPAKNPFFTVLAGVVGQFVPVPPPDPTVPGVFRLAPPEELARVLGAAGFSEVEVEARPMTLSYESLDEYWRVQTDLAAPLRAAMETLGPGEIARLKAAVLDAMAPFVEGGRVRVGAVPLCARAVR
ncbi:MAG: methyltransferase domain-containing protein [Gemmatimonadetes bacterium]|nr:methyltransferase domain-containing protein [Gemmatimonadota bacterium]